MRPTLPFLLLTVSLQMHATEFDGYYVGVRGDTVHVQFDIRTSKTGEIDYASISEIIKIAGRDRRSDEIRAGEIRYFFISGDLNEKFVSVKLHEEYVFLMEENNGKLMLYKHFFNENGGSAQMHYVVQSPFRRSSELTPIRFRKQLLKYTEDDKFFVVKFLDKSWKYNMLDELVADYNAQVADQD